MNDPELLAACGDDAVKWAEAFQQVIVNRGVKIDEGLMIGWFANAIENSSQVRSTNDSRSSLRRTLESIKEMAKGPLPWDRHEAVVMRTRIFDAARAALAAEEEGVREMRAIHAAFEVSAQIADGYSHAAAAAIRKHAREELEIDEWIDSLSAPAPKASP